MGVDLQSEQRTFLGRKTLKCPVILFDYPAKLKVLYAFE